MHGILPTSSASSASASSTSSLVIVAASALVLGLLMCRWLVYIWALSELHVDLSASFSASSPLLTFAGRVGLLVGGLASILLLCWRYCDGGGGEWNRSVDDVGGSVGSNHDRQGGGSVNRQGRR